jgi:hypothetical protein
MLPFCSPSTAAFAAVEGASLEHHRQLPKLLIESTLRADACNVLYYEPTSFEIKPEALAVTVVQLDIDLIVVVGVETDLDRL